MSSLGKLSIDAYETEDFSGRVVASYEARMNSTHGGPLPRGMSFELLFDSAGFNVADELKKFEDTVHAFDGEVQRPRYLRMAWGSEDVFPYGLTSLSITYQLFDVEGRPLRALANVSFSSFTSPDLLHPRPQRADGFPTFKR